MKKLFLFAVASAFAIAVSAGANASTYTIDAINDIPSWLDTGITASPGSTYQFSVINPATLWSAGSDIPFPRSSTADGIDPAFYVQTLKMGSPRISERWSAKTPRISS